MTRLPLVALLALTSPVALAFSPDGAVLGTAGVQRVHHSSGEGQLAIAQRSAWKAFTAAEGAGWKARFDEKVGTPLRMWGSPIDIGPTATEAQVVDSLIGFVDAHADILGADATELELRSAAYAADTDTWYVDLDVIRGGLRLLNGGVTARIRHGRLVMLGAETYPGMTAEAPRRLARTVAIDLAIRQGPAAAAVHTDESAEVGMVAVESDGVVSLRPAWRTTTSTALPVGRWESIVDADTGALLSAHNDIRFVDGTLSGEHDERTVSDDPLVTSPLAFVKITGSEGALVFADADAAYSVADTTATVVLDSNTVHVRNDSGAEVSWVLSGGSELLTASTESEQAQIDTYVFLRQVQAWGDRVAPGVFPAVTANTNIDQTCNAYYDGRSVNFFRSGNGCNNTGRIADIVFHEWGHGLHDNSLLSGVFDGSLSEGAADTVAFLQTGDHVIAPNFQRNGRSIRDVEPDRVYPDDYRNNELYVHDNGLIFGGAMWDLWGILADAHGEAEGRARTERIFTRLLRGGPDIASSYDEAVFADDDDGDLGNGTPNQCDIIDAFGLHGLGPKGADGLFVASHTPNGESEAGLPTEIVVHLSQEAPECFTVVPTGGTVHYSVNGGAWEEVALDLSQNDLTAAIPAQRMGDIVTYWVEIVDSEGGSSFAPADGEIAPFTYYVGDAVPVFCTDFEDNDGGFTHELLGGENIEGADDWQHGVPHGLSGDPMDAYDGIRVWGNDLGGGEYNGAYQNDRHNRLTSPTFDLKHYEGTFLYYQRWLTVEDHTYDHASILANGQVVWSNWEGDEDEHTVDRQWIPHAVDLGGVTDTVQIAYDLQSDEGLAFGGWNVDAFCLLAPATPDNRLGITDFVADGTGEAIEVSWTQPEHAPVTRVVVVRQTGDYPADHTDGDVVLELDAPELGAPFSFTDTDVGKHRSYYYAVYATDGEAWLSWTVPGWNAGAARADGKDVRAGCGCDVPATGLTAFPGLLLAGLLIRRRRS